MIVLLRRFGELGFGTIRFLKGTENEQGWFISFYSVDRTDLYSDPYTSKAVRQIIATSFRRRQQEVHQSPRLLWLPATLLPLEIQWAILYLLGMEDIVTKVSAIEWPHCRRILAIPDPYETLVRDGALLGG
jgi:hypothetical protein